MIEKTIKILLIILVFSLAFINSHLFDLVGIKLNNLYVNGNYEFSKVIFFNIFSGIIILLFLYNNIINKKEIKIPKISIFILILLIIANIFSESIFISFFGNETKAHSTILFTNLIGILIVLINQNKNFIDKLLKTLLLSTVIISIVSIWQYFYPTLNYGDLSNRALGTLGHPNYLALYLLLIIPYLYDKLKSSKKYILPVVLILFTLILTKSAWGIIIVILYTLYKIYKPHKTEKNKYQIYFLGIIFLIILSVFIFKYYPEKLHSFISRFFIWKSSLELSFDSPKHFLFGYGLETLSLTFEKTKSIYLYIFENIGFTADRPHNLIISIFYHMGFIGLSLFFYIIYSFIKYIKQNKNICTYCKESIIIFLTFSFFNFSSIAGYLVVILLIAKLLLNQNYKIIKNKIIKNVFLFLLFLISFIGISSSYSFYKSEIYSKQTDYTEAINTFRYNPNNYYRIGDYNSGLNYSKYKGENYFYSKINNNLSNIENNCEELIAHFPSSENYFYCGDILNYLGYEKLSTDYYKSGLGLLPDLWNKDSKYYKNFFINKFVDGKRFFSEKYSDLSEILDNLKIENNTQ